MLQNGYSSVFFTSNAVGNGDVVEDIADKIGAEWRDFLCTTGKVESGGVESFIVPREFELVHGYRSFSTMEKLPSAAVTTSKSLR